MFTLEQIEQAHNKVKSGADFPKYIEEIKALGVQSFETQVSDASTTYKGENGFQTTSKPLYAVLIISQTVNAAQFIAYLQKHQNGQTDFFAFCRHCAETGIVKWTVDLIRMTCTYFDNTQSEILVESIPAL